MQVKVSPNQSLQMKNILFCALLSLMFSACAKHKEPEVAAMPNCTGNNWQMDDPFYPGRCTGAFNDLPPLVYNNKVHVFHPVYPGSQGQVEVTIFDGTSWSTVQSTVPDTYPLCHAYFGFVIGNKGYLAGSIATFEYAFETNSWSTKAAFPGSYRTHAATFSIGDKGYIAGGSSASSSTINYADTWEFNPVTNQWTQKASLPRGAARTATGFAINNKGYILNGFYKNGNTPVYLKDLFEYDPVADEWNYKTFFPGIARKSTSVFIIAGMVYAGGGWSSEGPLFGNLKDFYKYIPSTNTWEQVADFSPFDVKDISKYGFAINNRGYVAFGSHTSDPDYYMLKYTPKSCIFPF